MLSGDVWLFKPDFMPFGCTNTSVGHALAVGSTRQHGCRSRPLGLDVNIIHYDTSNLPCSDARYMFG